MEKYRLLREQVAAALPGVILTEPPPAEDIDLARAHDPGYITRLSGGHLTKTEQQKIGFPWSEAMVERSRRSAGSAGTVAGIGRPPA